MAEYALRGAFCRVTSYETITCRCLNIYVDDSFRPYTNLLVPLLR